MYTSYLHRAHYDKATLHEQLENALQHPAGKTREREENYDRVHIEGAIKHTAGQDTIIHIPMEDDQAIFGCFDGHGDKGHFHSYIASGLLCNRLLACVPIFKMHLASEDTEKLHQLVKYCYLSTQDMLYSGNFTNIDNYSGTTAAVALVLKVNINGIETRKLISTNAGDSSIVWKEKGLDTQHTECSLEHNCDNMVAVQAYLDRLKRQREEIMDKIHSASKKNIERYDLHIELNALQPKPIYYFREHSTVATWLRSIGYNKPLQLYKYQDDKVTLNEEAYEVISEYYPHGSQSVRTPPTYIRDDGRTVAIEGREHDNWGSTLEGNTQTLNGLGDKHSNPHCSPEPFVSIHDINSKGTLLLASDGVTDLFQFPDLMKKIEVASKINDKTAEIMEVITFHTAGKHQGYPLSLNPTTGLKHPKWDDLSAIIVKLEKHC